MVRVRRYLVPLLSAVALLLVGCGSENEDKVAELQAQVDALEEELSAPATATTSTTAPSSTTTAAPTYCDEVLSQIKAMTAVDRDDVAALSMAYIGPDPDSPDGLWVVGLPTDTATGDPSDKRWTAASGMQTVGPFLETPDKSRFPAQVTHDGNAFACQPNTTEQPPPPPSPQALIAEWTEAFRICHETAGGDPTTFEPCLRQSALVQQLNAIGWCYGRENEVGAQMQWHVCGPGSLRQ